MPNDYRYGGFREMVSKPMDLALGLRLYKVEVRFPAEKGQMRGHVDIKIVAAKSPSHAAELVTRTYEGAEWIPGKEPTITGSALNVLQPKSFYEQELNKG